MTIFYNNRILIVHAIFWALYFSFFFYQISPSMIQGEMRDRKAHQEQIKDIPPPPKPPDAFWHDAPPPPPKPNFVGNRNHITIFVDTLVHVLFMMLISYTNYFYFLPRFLKKRNVSAYLLGFFTFFIVSLLVLSFLKIVISGDFNNYENSFFYSTSFFIELIINSLFIVIFISTLKFSENWIKAEEEKNQLEKECLQAELSLLKSQINPHFLFNTLNNLYALAYIQSPHTTTVIEKLSLIMRYLLQESKQKEVPLLKEVELLENFIALEKIRLTHSEIIVFDADKSNMANYKIAPMILITFLENAFKHGDKSSKGSFKSSLKIIDNSLFYKVENQKNKQNSVEKMGIGMENAKRQLDLNYPNRYHLDLQENEEKYCITLIINNL